MNDLIDGADLLIYRDGSARLILMGAAEGDPTPRTTPLELSEAEARALLAWLRRRGRVTLGEVRRELRRLEAAPVLASGPAPAHTL